MSRRKRGGCQHLQQAPGGHCYLPASLRRGREPDVDRAAVLLEELCQVCGSLPAPQRHYQGLRQPVGHLCRLTVCTVGRGGNGTYKAHGPELHPLVL